jgi:hypothetical protein
VSSDVDQELVGVDVLRQRYASQQHVDEVLHVLGPVVGFEELEVG